MAVVAIIALLWRRAFQLVRKGAASAIGRLKDRAMALVIAPEMMEWLRKEWDHASGSESTRDSAILGTVDECVEQLKAHLAVGVQKLIFVPYRYEMEQIETVAREIIPRLKAA
jgi:alkanesulfonate monooxygenase SsuD/methylene tetrahydromethanopterin reductase-like flavin-dependent oxidoreductase (luciferase family)